MTPLAKKLTEYGIRRFASEVPTQPINVRHFIRKRYNKIGRRTRKLIRVALMERDWLKKRKPQLRCICDRCGKVHAQGKHLRKLAQSQSVHKKSATRSHQ